MKHKNYEMITAKAADMDLVVFYDADDCGWILSTFENLTQMEHCDFFLCLPQHKDACLHWLNGGEIQDYYNGEWTKIKCHDGNPDWNEPDQLFMNEEFHLRIAPSKEKRIIGVNSNTGQTTSAYELDGGGNYAEDEIRLTKKGPTSEWQFIEIEIEV